MQRSDEVLKQAASGVGVKALAAELKLSPALVYKWCQPCESDDPEGSGARNPLDRIMDIVRVTNDPEVVNWLCNQVGGFYTPNPQIDTGNVSGELLQATQQLVKEFSDMLEEVSVAVRHDNAIVPAEAARIRRHWETLKRVAENFVVAGEAGLYREPKVRD